MHNKQLKIGAILSYVQIFLSLIISLSIHKIVLEKLGMNQNGLLNMATNLLSYLSLLTIGLGSAFIRYNMQYRVKNDKLGEAKLNGLFVVSYSIIALITAIIGIILIFCSRAIYPKLTDDEIFVLQIVMAISLLQTCLSLPFNVFSMNINAYEKFIFATVIGIINTVLVPISRLVVVLSGGMAISISIVSFAFSMLAFIIQCFYAVKKLKIKIKFAKLNFSLIKSIYTFSIFIFINQLVDMINWSMDTFILGVVAGAAVVSIYSVGASFNTYFINFSTAISSVLVPSVHKLVAEGDKKDELNRLFIKTGRIQFMILSLIILGFIFFGKAFILNYYATPEYINSYYISLILVVPLIIPLIQNLGIEIQRAYNKHKFRSIAYLIMALVNVAMTIPLSIYVGEVGAAIGTCVSLVVGNGLIMNIYYHKKLDLDMIKFWKSILKFIPALIIPCGLGVVFMLFADLSKIYWFFLSVCGFTIVYCLSIYFLGMNAEEKQMVKNIANKVFKRKNKTENVLCEEAIVESLDNINNVEAINNNELNQEENLSNVDKSIILTDNCDNNSVQYEDNAIKDEND